MSYVVEVYLDPRKRVQRTKVHHVQSDEEESWDGWRGERIIAFFSARPELSLHQPVDSASPVPIAQTVTTPSAEPEEIRPAFHVTGPASTLSVHRVSLHGEDGHEVPWVLPRDQKYCVRIELNWDDAPTLPAMLHYSATFVAKSLGQKRSVSSATQGRVKQEKSIVVEIPGPNVPSGVYRAFASVVFVQPKSSSAVSVGATSKGTVLQAM